MRYPQMKAGIATLALSGMLATGIALTPATAQAAPNVAIPDTALAKCVTDRLKLPEGSEVSTEQAASITSLSCSRRGISDLTGLEALTGVKALSLPSNNIKDLTPLTGLSELLSVTIQYNKELESLAPLASLPKLRSLNVNSSPKVQSSVSALFGLPLERLTLNNIGLTDEDLTGLANSLPKLEYLAVSNNKLTDVTALTAEKLPALTDIRLAGNALTDISALDGLNLKKMYAGGQWSTGASKAYVPDGATAFLMSTSLPDLVSESSGPVEVSDPDKYTDAYTVTGETIKFTAVESNFDELRVSFVDTAPRAGETFTGRIGYRIVWSSVTSAAPVEGTVGEAYSHQFEVTEGFPADKWKFADGAVPGLELDPSTGLLSGTPTEAGDFALTLTVEDSLGNAITHQAMVKVNPVPETVEPTTEPTVEPVEPTVEPVEPTKTVEPTTEPTKTVEPTVEHSVEATPSSPDMAGKDKSLAATGMGDPTGAIAFSSLFLLSGAILIGSRRLSKNR